MIYILSLFTLCAILFALAAYAWTRPRRPTTVAYGTVAFTQALWTLYFALDPITTSLPQKLLLDHAGWVVSYLFVLAMMYFVLVYTGRRWAHPRLTWALLGLPMLFFVVAAFTDERLHLFYTSNNIVLADGFSFLETGLTPIGAAAYLYAYAQAPVFLWFLFRHYGSTRGQFRTQTLLIAAGIFIPALYSIIRVLLDLVSGSPATSFFASSAYALGALLIAFGVFRLGLFRIVPIAHQYVFDRMADAVLVVNLNGEIVDANPAMRAFADPALADLIGRTPEEAFPRFAAEFRAFAGTGDVDTRFTSYLSSPPRHFDMKIRTIEDRDGKVLGRLGVIRDITEQVHLEEFKVSEETLKVALQKERELNGLKTKMMVRIAHEFRTPLSVIALNGEMLDKYYDKLSGERRREKIDEILLRIRHLTQVLNDITSVVQAEYASPNYQETIFTLDELRVECAETLTLNNRTIKLNSEATEQMIRTDRRGLRNAITELIQNAIKFSPDDSVIQVNARFDGNDLVIEVRDEGIGIPKEDVPRIFEPFYRGYNAEDIAGLGLGLSVVQDFVQRQQGRLSVSSPDGQGSTFTLVLPDVVVTDFEATEDVLLA